MHHGRYRPSGEPGLKDNEIMKHVNCSSLEALWQPFKLKQLGFLRAHFQFLSVMLTVLKTIKFSFFFRRQISFEENVVWSKTPYFTDQC